MLHESSFRLSKVGLPPPYFPTHVAFFPTPFLLGDLTLVWYSRETLQVPCTEVSGHLDTCCHRSSPGLPVLTDHYPAPPSWSGTPPKASTGLAAVLSLKAQECFLNFFLHPQTSNSSRPPHPPIPTCLYVWFLASESFPEVLPGRLFRRGEEAGEGRGAGGGCIAASPFEVSVVSSIKRGHWRPLPSWRSVVFSSFG